VGSDEAFFEDDRNDETILDLYNEKAGILDGDVDGEVDLASYAYQIWKNAVTTNPELQKIIPGLQPVVYSTKAIHSDDDPLLPPLRPVLAKRGKGGMGGFDAGTPEGVLVYLKTTDDNDALAWIDRNGKSVTESQFTVLRAAECSPDTPAIRRDERHHELVKAGVELIINEEKFIGGQLGRPSGARFRTYEKLKRHAERLMGTLFESPELLKAIEDIYRYSLRPAATDTLNRQLRSDISDEDLAKLVLSLREEGRLCIVQEENQVYEPRILCSLGLFHKEGP
jgi:hypothetical protein